MKISVIMQSFENGGVQRVMINLISGLLQKKCKIDIVVADGIGEMKTNISKDCKIFDFKKKNAKGDFKLLFSLFKIKKYINENKPEVVIACPGFANIVLIIANKFSKHKTKTVVIIDNKLSLLKKGNLKHRISYFFYSKFLRYADLIVTAHDNAKKDIIENFGISTQKVVRIYHPLISSDLINSEIGSLKHKWFNKNYYVILAVGRLVKEKNFVNLIYAFKSLKDEEIKYSNLKLIVVGDGPEREKLLEIIDNLKLNDDIDLVGYSDKPFEFMKNSNMYVLSSSKEAFGNVLVEALSCGLPVVATDCESGGPREILKDGEYGFLCKMDDIDDLKSKMIMCYESKCNKEKNIKRGFEFSIDNSVNGYYKAILNMLKMDEGD